MFDSKPVNSLFKSTMRVSKPGKQAPGRQKCPKCGGYQYLDWDIYLHTYLLHCLNCGNLIEQDRQLEPTIDLVTSKAMLAVNYKGTS